MKPHPALRTPLDPYGVRWGPRTPLPKAGGSRRGRRLRRPPPVAEGGVQDPVAEGGVQARSARGIGAFGFFETARFPRSRGRQTSSFDFFCVSERSMHGLFSKTIEIIAGKAKTQAAFQVSINLRKNIYKKISRDVFALKDLSAAGLF